MAKINMNNVYKDRINQIEIDIKKCIREKKWAEVARLEAEKSKLEGYINND